MKLRFTVSLAGLFIAGTLHAEPTFEMTRHLESGHAESFSLTCDAVSRCTFTVRSNRRVVGQGEVPDKLAQTLVREIAAHKISPPSPEEGRDWLVSWKTAGSPEAGISYANFLKPRDAEEKKLVLGLRKFENLFLAKISKKMK